MRALARKCHFGTRSILRDGIEVSGAICIRSKAWCSADRQDRWRAYRHVPSGRQKWSLTMTCRHGLQACSLSPSIGERVQGRCWFVLSRIKRDSVGFRGFIFTPRRPSSSMQGSDGRSLITPTGRALTRCLWSVTCQSPPRTRKAPLEKDGSSPRKKLRLAHAEC